MLKASLQKLISIIQPEKDKSIIDKENLDLSFSNFISHFKEPKKSLMKDIDLIKKCKLTNIERNLSWLFFLNIIPIKEPSSWKKIISLEREHYSKLRHKYITLDIESFIELKRELDTEKYDNYKSIINVYDFDLLNLIKNDIQRTFQEDEIFKLDIVKKKLITILYIYAKENPDVGYQQGMNDICGVFLYVVYKDFYIKTGFEKDELSSIYSLIHSNNVYLEYDVYLIFNKFMNKGIRQFFLYNTKLYKENILGSKTIEEKIKLNLEDIISTKDSELKKRIYILFYVHFKQLDKNFFNFLMNNIYPELFILRWYLGVFTREFKLSQVVFIWDLIIMYEYLETNSEKNEKKEINNNKIHLNFIECIALSMLSYFKSDIMQKEDKNEIMSEIMHYPTSDMNIEKLCKKSIEIYSSLFPDNNNIYNI